MFTLALLMFLLMGFAMFFGAIFLVIWKLVDIWKKCDFVGLFKEWWNS